MIQDISYWRNQSYRRRARCLQFRVEFIGFELCNLEPTSSCIASGKLLFPQTICSSERCKAQVKLGGRDIRESLWQLS
jgi:hypothetical protein